MKKFTLLLFTLCILSSVIPFQQAAGQEKTKAELEKEAKLQQTIEQQKKAINDQKRAQEEAMTDLKEKMINLDDFKMQVDVENSLNAEDAVRVYSRRGARASAGDNSFMFVNPGAESFYGHSFGGDAERTTWDFSKTVKENTFTRDYTFDVEKTVNTVVMSVMGDCKAGEIRIKIVMPNGKNYSDIVIDEFGNLNWRKSFSISETENQDKAGDWKFQITSTKATGFFKISLQTY